MSAKIPWYSIGRFALILLCLAIVLVLVITVLPIHLDVTAFKGPVEETLSDLLGASVTITEIRLHPSLWPTLLVSGLEMEDLSGERSVVVGHLAEIELKVSLLPLFRDRIRIKRFFASGASIRLRPPLARAGERPAPTTSKLEFIELSNFELENATLVLEDRQERVLILDTLTSDIGSSTPLDLKLQGSLQGLPLTVAASGPTLASLTQATDFPIAVQVQMAELSFDLDGSVSRAPSGTTYQFSFALESPELASLQSLWEQDLPRLGRVQFAGQISNREAILEISELSGSVGTTSVHGRLALEHRERRVPHLSGRLSLGDLDLEPWIEHPWGTDSDPSDPLPFAALATLDADVKLTVQSLVGLSREVDDLSLQIALSEALLSIPTTFSLAGVPLSADLEIRGNREVPEIQAHIWAKDLTLEQLDQIIDIPDVIVGRFGELDLEITSSGHSMETLETNLLVEAIARKTLFTLPDESGKEPIELYFDRARVTHRPAQPLTASANGSLFEREFSAQLTTGSLANLLEDHTWPLSMTYQRPGANIELDGSLARGATGTDVDLHFDIAGTRLGELEDWLGISPDTDLPFELTGQITSVAGAQHLRLGPSSLGRSRFSGELSWSIEDISEPFIVDLHATALDIQELHNPSDSVLKLDAEQKVIAIDVPIVPSQVTFHDAKIELTVDRYYRDTVDLTDVTGSFHFREGRLEESPFSFRYDTQTVTGEIDLDLRGDTPKFALEVHGQGDQLGRFLQQENLVDSFQVVASDLDLRIEGSGASVREIIQTADLSGELVDVRWTIYPEGFEKPLHVRLDRVDLRGPRGEPIVLTAKGDLDNVPLDLRLDLRVPEDSLLGSRDALPFHLTLGLAATEVELEGEAALPVTRRDVDTQILVQGETLLTLSALAGTDLPDLGPYRLQGFLDLGEGGFSLRDLDLVLGETDLRGELSYHRIEGRPTIEADLTSQLVRTQDIFGLDPSTSDEEAEQQVPAEESAIQTTPEAVRALLDRLRGIDIAIDLSAREVRAIDDSSHDLEMNLKLDHGSLDLLATRAQESGRNADLTARIRPWETGVDVHLQAYWERQPYGLFGDLISPGSAEGSWSADLDLSSRGADLQDLTSNLSGYLHLANYPADVDTTIFDIWGGGLLTSILPVFQIGPESRLNCSVAKFQIDQGLVTPESLIIDSTRTRISGKGSIDLPGNRLDLKLKPRPKQRNLINLSTPVRLRGSLTDPEVSLSKSGVAVTFFRLSLWVYTVWRDIARKPLPTDGQDICLNPFAQVQQQ